MKQAAIPDQPIQIQQQTTAQDALGQPLNTWTTVFSPWASIRYTYNSGLQAARAGADQAVVFASMRIRYRAGIDSGMRVIWEGEAYNIKAVIKVGRKQWLDLVCEVIQ